MNGNLIVTINEGNGLYVHRCYIENGDLICEYKDGDIMAKVNLGRVVGEKGDTGISPTFSIESGNLYADYDNPYTPTA